ncbi:MAG: efflux RND transporter periplasmic adaptor subunit [Burkholderiaceae bacterium]
MRFNFRLFVVLLIGLALVLLVAYRMGWLDQVMSGSGGSPQGPTAQGASAPKAPGGGGPARPGAMAAPVEVAKVIRREVSDTLWVTGEFKATDRVDLRPEIAGRIAELGFRDGQKVTPGQVLVRLDDSLLRAEYAQAKAEADLAQSNLARAQELFDRQFISPRGLDEAKANAAVAKARQDLSFARLARTEIRAPFAGRAGLKDWSVGDYVKEGERLVTIEDTDRMHFDFRVPERFAGQVSVGQVLSIQTEGYSDDRLYRVSAVDVEVDQNGRFLRLRAVTPNADGRWKTGMFGRAGLRLKTIDDGLLVSEEALVGDREGFFVWRVSEGKVQKVRIKLGIRLEKEVQVLEGLAEGDEVVVAGQLKIRTPGQDVRILNAAGGKKP